MAGTGFIDACSKYLVTNFVTGNTDGGAILPVYNGGVGAGADLALWPCKQDLRQDRKPTCTKAKFDVWNEYEVKFTGAYQCFKCFFEGYLEQIGTVVAGYSDNTGKKSLRYGKGPAFGPDKFWGTSLRTRTARLRVEGIASTVCNGVDAGGSLPLGAKTKGCYWTDPADGVTKAVASEATPLLGVLTYADPSVPTVFEPYAGYTLFGAGFNLTGFIKYDNGGFVMAPGR